MKCSYCNHDDKDHCKGNVLHENYKDEMKQAGMHGQHRKDVCTNRHCLHPICDCTNFQETNIMPFPKTNDEMQSAGYKFDDFATCKGCGEDIEWWITPLGKKIPMNMMERGSSEAIAHWSTCPEADSFRKK